MYQSQTQFLLAPSKCHLTLHRMDRSTAPSRFDALLPAQARLLIRRAASVSSLIGDFITYLYLRYRRGSDMLSRTMSGQARAGQPAPPSSRTPCPRCRATDTLTGTLTAHFVFLRCGRCYEGWAISERRHARRSPVAALHRGCDFTPTSGATE